MMKLLCSIVLVIALALFLGARAESADMADLISGKKVQWKSREYRIDLAESIESALLTFYLGIPNVSPEQKKWLAAEEARIDSIRNDDAKVRQRVIFAGSVAFRLEGAKLGISQQLTSVECIKNPKVSFASEMVCWAVLALKLQDGLVFESIQQLHKEGRVTLPDAQGSRLIFDSNSSLGLGYWPEVYGEGILEYILIPYLVENQQTK